METEKALQVDNDTAEKDLAAKKVRLLLALWDLGGLDTAVKKGALNKRIVKKGEKSADYSTILESLEQDDKAIGRITTSKGTQFRMTQSGEHTLVKGLKNQYLQGRTNTEKALLKLFLKISTSVSTTQDEPEMDFEVFKIRFKDIYLEVRKVEELRGAVVIYGQEICDKFASQFPISKKLLVTYFERLKTTGQIFAVQGRDGEMIQWVE
jgi:hypothetical protein